MKQFVPAISLVLTVSVLSPNEVEYPRPVNVYGQVFYTLSDEIYYVENCQVLLNGLDSELTVWTDSVGKYAFDIEIKKEFVDFDFSLIFNFSKQLTTQEFAVATQPVRSRYLLDGYYNMGKIFLESSGGFVKRDPTVWDLLEDSLITTHQVNKDLRKEIGKLISKLGVLKIQNDDYQKRLLSLTQQSAEYFDEMAGLKQLNSKFSKELAEFKTLLEKHQLSKVIYDNFFMEAYLDMMQVRDSLISVIYTSAENPKHLSDEYYSSLDKRNMSLFRLDLFAESAGIKAKNYEKYSELSTFRNDIFVTQDSLIKSGLSDENSQVMFKDLKFSATSVINIQDSLVVFDLIQYDKYKEYEVSPGDHLWQIAKHEPAYKNPYAWRIIYLFNKDQIADPESIAPGQIIKIPLLSE